MHSDPHTAWTMLVEQISFAADHGLAGININTSSRGDYIHAPKDTDRARVILELALQLHDSARAQGLNTTQSGPQLTKWHGLARPLSFPIETGRARLIPVDEYKLGSDGRTFHEDLALYMTEAPPFVVQRVVFRASHPGTLQLLHENGAVMNQFHTKTGYLVFPHINIPGLYPANVVFKADDRTQALTTRAERIVLHAEVRGDSADTPREANNAGEWVGNPNNGFLHLKMPDPTDFEGLHATCQLAGKYLPGIQQICETDEMQAFWPQPHAEAFPGGWPHWLGWYQALYAHTCFAQTGQWPILMLTDPVLNIESRRFNRMCVPVPWDKSPDYLPYLKGYGAKPTIMFWGANDGVRVVRNCCQRITDNGFNLAIGVDAEIPQSWSTIAEALGAQRLRELPIHLYYYGQAGWSNIPSLVNAIKESLS